MKIAQLSDPVGTIPLPTPLAAKFGTVEGGALGVLLQLGIQIMIVIAGIWALINFILAGYGFLSAGNKPENVANATAKIWQSVVGLLIAAGALLLAAIFGKLLFGDFTFLLRPTIPTP